MNMFSNTVIFSSMAGLIPLFRRRLINVIISFKSLLRVFSVCWKSSIVSGVGLRSGAPEWLQIQERIIWCVTSVQQVAGCVNL